MNLWTRGRSKERIFDDESVLDKVDFILGKPELLNWYIPDCYRKEMYAQLLDARRHSEVNEAEAKKMFDAAIRDPPGSIPEGVFRSLVEERFKDERKPLEDQQYCAVDGALVKWAQPPTSL